MKRITNVSLLLILSLALCGSLTGTTGSIVGDLEKNRQPAKIDMIDIGMEKDFWLSYWCPNAGSYIWDLPNNWGDRYHAQRFSTTPGEDTLGQIGIYFRTSNFTGNPDARVSVWGDLGGVPDSADLIYTAVIINADIVPNNITTHNVSGTVEVPTEFHISVTVDNPAPDDTIAVISDDSYCGERRATFSQDGEVWYYIDDYWGNADVNFLIMARMGGTYNGPVWYVDSAGVDNPGRGSRWDPLATFQYAIDQASDGDTIIALSSGQFVGAGNKDINLGIINLVIKGELGAAQTVINVQGTGDDGFRLTTLHDSTTVIEGLTIKNADQGIYLQGTSPKIRQMTLDSNTYGIYNITIGGGTPQVLNSDFAFNTTAILSDGTGYNSMHINGCTFSSNDMAVYGDFYIKHSTIESGEDGLATGGEGPGGYQFRADTCIFTGLTGNVLGVGFMSTLTGCKIQNNACDYIAYGFSMGTTYLLPTFNNCEIDNNSGSGMRFVGRDVYLTMNNTRYSYNTGGISYNCNYRGEVDIDNCHFSNNDTTVLYISAIDAVTIAPINIARSTFVENDMDGIRIYDIAGGATLTSNTFARNDAGVSINEMDDNFYMDSCISAFNNYGVEITGFIDGDTAFACSDVYGNTISDYSGVLTPTGNWINMISSDPIFCDTSHSIYHLQAISPCAPTNNACNTQIGALPVGCDELRPLIIFAESYTTSKVDCPSIVNIKVWDPSGDSIGYNADGVFDQTIFPADYAESTSPDCDDTVYIHFPIEGEYLIEVVLDPSYVPDPGDEPTYTIGVQIDGSLECVQADGASAPAEGESDSYHYTVEEGYHYLNGDADRNDLLNILDITFLIAFLYGEPAGPAPDPIEAGDAHCDDGGNGVVTINILDITFMIAYLYGEPAGPDPCSVF